MTSKDQGLAEIDASAVRAGQRWKHYKGGHYDVVAIGLLEATLDPVVVYAGRDGVVWVRTLFVFTEEVAPGVPRFAKIDEEEHHVVTAVRRCLMSEDSCKAADCPEHGWTPAAPAHPMMGTPRGGRFL